MQAHTRLERTGTHKYTSTVWALASPCSPLTPLPPLPSLQVMMYCWEMMAEDRPSFAYLRDNLEKLKGGESVDIGATGAAEAEPEPEAPPEPPARRRSTQPEAQADWREQFEHKSGLAATGDMDLQEVMDNIREVFGLAQRIVRYSSEDTVANDVEMTIAPCEALCGTLSGVPGLDKTLVKVRACAIDNSLPLSSRMLLVFCVCLRVLLSCECAFVWYAFVLCIVFLFWRRVMGSMFWCTFTVCVRYGCFFTSIRL